MEKAGLERSMSKKGCAPDNSACEGLLSQFKKMSAPPALAAPSDISAIHVNDGSYSFVSCDITLSEQRYKKQ